MDDEHQCSCFAPIAHSSPYLPRLGVDAGGDVVIVESETPKIVAKLSQEAAYERLAATADTTRKQIEQIHNQGRKQAEQWSRFSLIAAILGFIIVLGGALAILLGNTPAGLVTTVAGIIPEVAAALFFRQAKEANKRVDVIREKLLEAEGIHRTIELSMTTDEEKRDGTVIVSKRFAPEMEWSPKRKKLDAVIRHKTGAEYL